MSLQSAMRDACRVVGIDAPPRVDPGQTRRVRVDGKGTGNRSGAVKLDSNGAGGVATNFVTGQSLRFNDRGTTNAAIPAPRRDPEREREAEAERREVVATCERIARACEAAQHPYLARKGFPDELGMVIEDPRPLMPQTRLGEAIAAALPESDGPLLVIPGRIAKTITTLQFITADGAKKNIMRGQMSGASHRIATGRETWVCEGIATAMTIRAALRLLGRSATVLSAFSASNVGKVAAGLHGSVVAADHDAPQETLGGLGAGEYFAVKSGRKWLMPKNVGDFNDLHQAEGLRAVAMHIRGMAMPP